MSRPDRGGGTSDKAVLHRFGYAQELLRDMGGFSNFAISFSIISILTGAVTLYGVGLNAGGPLVMGIGWPLVTFFVLFVAAAMAELASAIPTSGALYHWASFLGGPTWGWMTAWLNLIGLIAAVAGIDYGCAEFVVRLLGGPPQTVMPVFAALVVSHAWLNHVGIRAVARLNDFSAVYHVAGVAIVILALAFFSAKQPVSWLFTKTFTTVKEQPYWFAFLGGLLQAQWTYTGYDASAHTIEETRNARVGAPWGIYLSVAISGLFGYFMLAFVTLAIKDLGATAAGVWLAAVLSFLLPCLILAVVRAFPEQLDFSKLYPAVTGVSTIGLYLSYGIPLLLKLRAIRRGVWTERANGPWSLGDWSVPVNVVALVWIGFITVLFVLPPNELTGYIFAGTFVAMAGFYFVRVRGRFRGPVPQAKSRQELLRMEAELEK